MSETLSPNTTIAQYLVISKIGEGGMGKVYRARDTTSRLTFDPANDGFEAGVPKALFDLESVRAVVNNDIGYTLTPDAQRSLFVSQGEETANLQYTIVVNWTADLKR